MRKVLALAACLAVLLATLFSEPPRATAEHPLQDELVQRKAAAAEAKGQKATQPAEQDFDQLKADARARKGATTAPAADSQPEQPEQADADILAQSSKLRRGKAAVQEELVRSPELTQTFDSLREKALAAGTGLVVVRPGA